MNKKRPVFTSHKTKTGANKVDYIKACLRKEMKRIESNN